VLHLDGRRLEATLDACAHDDDQTVAAGAALERAEQLVATAAARLQSQEERLEELYGLVECLIELGPPMAVVEGQTVRAWSPALEALTGVRSATAVGAGLDGVLPSLSPEDPTGQWHWTDWKGSRWEVEVHQTDSRLRVLHWTQRLAAAEDAVAVTA
jgi:PAS domain-containing protein